MYKSFEQSLALEIFNAGVESVKPDNLINRYISLKKDKLQIEKINFDLSKIKNIYVVGAGKASAMMAQSIEKILGSRITDGHIVTKYNHSLPLKIIKVTEAGHPVPDENGIKGTSEILAIVEKAEIDDLVICLISGGGSALLADVPEGCTLEDLISLNNILLKSGANIIEMNCIRKHLSKVKGGLLARKASPARVVSLILSDVIGDPIDAIASGPTAADPTTFAEAISILKKYGISDQIPGMIYKVLLEGADLRRPETLKETDETIRYTDNLVIGTNLLALAKAKEKADLLGYSSHIITNKLEGDVTDVCSFIIGTAKSALAEKRTNKTCLLFAGEPTVKVTGNGLGGRNQHLALMMAKLLNDLPGITFLSGGTDGSDGPTDAAGAVVDSTTSASALKQQFDIDQYIKNCDSYNFFRQFGGLVITGPTQTNVMDLMVMLIE